MAEQLFIKILNMSLTGSFVILTVLAMRILLKKAPRIFSYCLWAVVLFRLLCPVSFSAAFSPLNALSSPTVEHGMIEYIPQEVIQPTQPLPSQGNLTSPSIQPDEESIPNPNLITKPTFSTLQIAAGIWLCGILLMALYSIIMLINLKQHLKSAAWERDNIYTTQTISTPFVIGMIKPRIYLPSSLENYEREYVLLHEQIHIKRFDHIVKFIAFVTLCIHWFNPFVWVAFFLSGKDMEMSCDEAVIRKIGSRMKKEYSASLLSMATGKRIISGVPLAFGEGDTGSRIKNVLRYKKPAVFVVNVTAIVCIVTTIVLLANPYRARNVENSSPSQVYYGVVTETTLFDNTTRKILMIPGLGEMEIPNAESISTYFEREEQELLPGDLVEITFPAGEEVSIQETWPSRFSASAESIVVKWSGFSLQHTNGDSYQLTFPTGAFPELSDVRAGDKLSFYREEPEELAFATSPPESEDSRLIATAPILAAGENEYGGPTLTIELSSAQIQEIFSGFGLYIRFSLESEAGALAEAQPITPTVQFNGEMTGEGTYFISARSISKSAKVIDSYVSSYDAPYNGEKDLVFAENCVFIVNFSMSGIDYQEVSFDTFADFVNEGSHWVSKPCLVTFTGGLITEAKLESAYNNYGISYSEFSVKSDVYDYLLENEGEAAFDKYYSLANSETLDIADCSGSELIEIYTGNLGDGASGIVMFKDAQGRLLFTQDAHIARAGWNNIYLGEVQGTAFIMNISIEDRWDYGQYGYWVYRLDENGGIKQIAGSEFNFTLPETEDTIKYDDALFKEWVDGMSSWLENSHLILSSQEGEIRTEKISEADKYNYDTLNLRDREL